MVVHEQGISDVGGEEEDRVLSGFYLQEVIKDGEGMDVFYVMNEMSTICESNILSVKGSREYKLTMELTNSMHNGRMLWRCNEVHFIRNLGKAEYQRIGREKYGYVVPGWHA